MSPTDPMESVPPRVGLATGGLAATGTRAAALGCADGPGVVLELDATGVAAALAPVVAGAAVSLGAAELGSAGVAVVGVAVAAEFVGATAAGVAVAQALTRTPTNA